MTWDTVRNQFAECGNSALGTVPVMEFKLSETSHETAESRGVGKVKVSEHMS